MRTADLSKTTLNAYSSAESSVDHLANSWGPPIAPTESSHADDSFLGEQAFGATGDEHLFKSVRQSDLHQILTSFGSRRKLIVGSAVVATLGVAALAYVFWFSAGEKTTTQTAETTATVQSSPVAPVRADPRTPAPYPAPLSVPAWPDRPASAPVEASPQIAAAAPAGNTATRQTVPARQNQDIAFVQRPGVNIRSTPSSNGSVLGIVPKGKRFKVTKREGDWVQVESDYLKGWIKSQFLGPNDAR
jgi:hypothetical protein